MISPLGEITSTLGRNALTTAPSQRVLVLTSDSDQRARLGAAVELGGATPVLVGDLIGLETTTTNPTLPFRFIVSAVSTPDELSRLCARLRPNAQLIAIVSKTTLAASIAILREDRCNHVILDDDEGLQTLRITIAKFVSGDLFGIEKHLPTNTAVQLTRLRDYKGRTAAVDEVLGYAEKIGVRRQIRSSIGQVCEELLMNALYDAPVDASGTPIFAEVDVKERLAQLSPRPVSIRYAATDHSFVVSVRDRFGRLDKATVLRYIDKCLHSSDQIDRKIYGAGLGIYLIVNAATQFTLNVAPGVATEVVCSFDRKGARGTLRSISMCLYPGSSPSDLHKRDA